jgi:hypothetical protein
MKSKIEKASINGGWRRKRQRSINEKAVMKKYRKMAGENGLLKMAKIQIISSMKK